MKYYLDILGDIYKSYHQDLVTGSNKLSDYLDNLIIWIISLSTGLIALIFAVSGKIVSLPQDSINNTLVILVMTIFFGVFGRGLSGISNYISFQLESIFNFNLKTIDIRYNPRELKGDESAEMIYAYLQSDFDAVFPFIIENMKSLKDTERENYDEKIRRIYIAFAEDKKQDMDLAIKAINSRMIESYGFKKNHFDKKRRTNNRLKGCIMRICTSLSSILFILCLLSFLGSITYISIKYFQGMK
jgi:hypothetical protein